MRFILPKIYDENRDNEKNCVKVHEYARRTELITKMYLAGWLTEAEIDEYIDGIIAEAEPFDDQGAIFWTVDDPRNMPRDARMDWAYEPTYNITALLIGAYWKKPKRMDELPGYKAALKGGMLASTYADFRRNHSADDNCARAIYELFCWAGANQFCSPGFNADLCPEFTRLFFGYREYFYKQDAILACEEVK